MPVTWIQKDGFTLICPPEMAMLPVEELLHNSLVKECTESTFSSSTVILLVISSALVIKGCNLSP
jgi:hypothetical protein